MMNDGHREMEEETIPVTIPMGADDGMILCIKNSGNIIQNVCGDVKICIQIKNDTEFGRNGNHLTFHKQITLKQALCGFQFEIIHLNNKKLVFDNLKTKQIIDPNYKKVIPNMGMQSPSGETGNLIIQFEISFPKSLTPEQMECLESCL
jgi:DnaJ-class molecular chaperone